MTVSSQPKGTLPVDKDLVIIFLLVAITGIIFFFVANQRAFLNFFYLPVLFGAYSFGKRYATMSALLSVILICTVAYVYPMAFSFSKDTPLYRWLDITTWGGFLLITGYYMGLLYEKKEDTYKQLKRTYMGIIEMLSLLIDSVDKETRSHSFRVSVVAEMLARQMRFPEEEVENIRIAALLHDLGKVGISAEMLKGIGKLSDDELVEMRRHPRMAADVLGPVGGKVLEILPLILHHHERFDGSGYHAMVGKEIPMGARIVAVADVYDALTSDRSYRKALSPFEARKEIVGNSGSHFDPEVVEAFEAVFPKLYTETPVYPDAGFNGLKIM
jgi:HD-GYP domain-containing protein (c-di-GMP phosphodiesterase class II)